MTDRLKTLAGLLSERWREPSTCEACGDQFICGASLTGCWCTELELSDETRADLRTRFSSCLCRKCLEKTTQGKVAVNSNNLNDKKEK